MTNDKSDDIPSDSGPDLSPDPAAPDGPARRPKRGHKRSRRHGLALWAGAFLIELVVVVLLLGLVLQGKDIALPGWIVADAERRLNASVAPARLSVGGASVVLASGEGPKLRLRDITLRDDKGRTLAQLPALRTTVSGTALLRGELHFNHVSMDKARIRLRREPDGRFNLQLGAVSTPAGQAASLPQALDQFNRALARPVLAAIESFAIEGLSLQYDDRRAGRSWQVEDGLVTIEQSDSDIAMQVFFALSSDSGAPAEMAFGFSADKSSRATRVSANFSDMAAADIGTQAPALAFLSVLDAPISGAIRTGTDADGALLPLSAALDIGQGSLRPSPGARAIPFTQAKSYFRYDPASAKLSYTDIQITTDQVSLSADGHSYLKLDATGWPEALTSQLRFRELALNPGDLLGKPARFARGAVDLKTTLAPFSVRIGQAALIDEQGNALRAKGRIGAGDEGWQVALDLDVPRLGRDQLMAFWPASVVPPTRAWVDKNVRAGRLENLNAALRLTPGAAPVVSVSGDIHDGSVRFLPHMPMITDGLGYLSIADNAFHLVVERGRVTAPDGARVDVSGSRMRIDDVTKRPPRAIFDIRANGAIPPVLAVLDNKPLQIMTKAGRAPDIAQGMAQARAVIGLDLRKKIQLEDVRFEVDGTLSGVRSDTLVQGKTLRADELTLRANTDGISIGGLAALDGVTFRGAWQQTFGPENRGRSQVVGKVALSDDALRRLGIDLPKGSVSGTGWGDLNLDLTRDAPPRFALRSDLAGVALSIPGLGWSKPASGTGAFSISGSLGKPAVVDSLSLQAAGLDATGQISLREGGGLDTARFERLRVGNWLDASVRLSGRGAGVAPGVALTGGTLNVARMPQGQGGGGAASSDPVQLQLDRLTLSPTLALRAVRGEIRAGGGATSGTITGRVNGKAPVQVTLSRHRNGTAIRALSNDAGAVLEAAGIFAKARGGGLDLALTPRGPRGDYDGTARITRTRVKGAPVLAELLTAISVVGIIELLDGDGLVFGQVDGDFRLTPDFVQLRKGSAVGPSLGISMDGIYELGNKQLDMRGVISPVYLVNGVGSVLTRRGEGLFGFNYRLAGSADAPRISVNPLSILTPGFLREIFRGPAPQPGGQSDQ